MTSSASQPTPPIDAPLPRSLGAPEAHAMALDGSLLLVDIRAPNEWTRSGMPEGAKGLTVTGPEFVDALLQLMDGDKSRRVGLICATGNRSSQVQAYLLANGFAQVTDVNEGMMGNQVAGPGWLLRGLPTVPFSG